MLIESGKAADGTANVYIHIGSENVMLVPAVDFNILYYKYKKALKDAERYRILREHGDFSCNEKDGFGGTTLMTGSDLDAAVDAQIEANKGE